MIRVVVAGATGRLGHMVCDMIMSSDDMELVGAVVSPTGKNVGAELYLGIVASVPDDLPKILRNADVYVDFTSPDAAADVIASIPESKVNLILGTTAVPSEKLDAMAKNVAKHGTSALVSANFAIGVNVFWSVAEKMAEMLSGYDIEIIETHHSGKKDSPSGTAAELLKRLQNVTGIDNAVYGRHGVTDGRGREIGVHSIRAGNVVGDHTVVFAGSTEKLELRHDAISREAFADGCLTCIRWIYNKKDGKVHGMREVLGL